MDDLHNMYAVTYQWHDFDEIYHTETAHILAESIGLALNEVDIDLGCRLEKNNWSDYSITSIAVIPELH